MAYINGKEILFSPNVQVIDNATLSALIDHSITEIEIPSETKYIASYAFRGCDKLKKVTFLGNPTSIGQYSFALCTELTKIDIPNGCKTLNFAAFQSSGKLAEVTLPNTLTYIDQFVFHGTAIAEITLPNSIPSMHPQAFDGCSKLKTIYCDWAEGDVKGAPWGATSAELIYLRRANTEGLQFTLNTEGTAYTVTGYTGTETEVYIASTYKGLPITEIGNNAFDPQNGVNFGGATKIEIAEGITKIGDYAFAMNAALETVILPSTLESIGTLAFDTCSSLRNIEIPDSVTSIGDSAFGYSGLYSATLGRGCLWNVTNEIFNGCNSLTNIYVPWDDGNNDGSPWGATNAQIHYANE